MSRCASAHPSAGHEKLSDAEAEGGEADEEAVGDSVIELDGVCVTVAVAVKEREEDSVCESRALCVAVGGAVAEAVGDPTERVVESDAEALKTAVAEAVGDNKVREADEVSDNDTEEVSVAEKGEVIVGVRAPTREAVNECEAVSVTEVEKETVPLTLFVRT